MAKKGLKFSHVLSADSFQFREIPCQENQVVGGYYDLLGGEWDSSSVGEVDSYFYLVDDRFERLVDIVHGCHVGGVILQGCRVNILVMNIEVSNHLEAT